MRRTIKLATATLALLLTASLDLGQNRKGCTPSGTIPPEATCDIAIAFPDVGLHGTVTIVGSDRSSSNDTLTFKLDN